MRKKPFFFGFDKGKTLEEAAQKGCGVLILGDIQDLAELIPEPSALANPALARVLD